MNIFEVKEIWRGRNLKLKKIEVEEIWNWRNLKFEVEEIQNSMEFEVQKNLKCRTFEIWRNLKSKKFEVEEIRSWRNLKAKYNNLSPAMVGAWLTIGLNIHITLRKFTASNAID